MTHPDGQNKAECLRTDRKIDLGLQQRRTSHMSASSELINSHASAQTDGYRAGLVSAYARDTVYICAGRSPDVHASAAETAHRTSTTSSRGASRVIRSTSSSDRVDLALEVVRVLRLGAVEHGVDERLRGNVVTTREAPGPRRGRRRIRPRGRLWP